MSRQNNQYTRGGSKGKGGASQGAHLTRQEVSSSANTKTSKSLSYLLRHGAAESGITLNEDGYADWADIQKNCHRFRGVTLEAIEQVWFLLLTISFPPPIFYIILLCHARDEGVRVRSQQFPRVIPTNEPAYLPIIYKPTTDAV